MRKLVLPLLLLLAPASWAGVTHYSDPRWATVRYDALVVFFEGYPRVLAEPMEDALCEVLGRRGLRCTGVYARHSPDASHLETEDAIEVAEALGWPVLIHSIVMNGHESHVTKLLMSHDLGSVIWAAERPIDLRATPAQAGEGTADMLLALPSFADL